MGIKTAASVRLPVRQPAHRARRRTWLARFIAPIVSTLLVPFISTLSSVNMKLVAHLRHGLADRAPLFVIELPSSQRFATLWKHSTKECGCGSGSFESLLAADRC